MTAQPSQKTGSRASRLARRLLGTRLLYFLKDMPIGSKLTVGFGLLVALMFVSAGIVYLGSGQATAKINLTNDVRVPTALAAARAQTSLLQMERDLRGYLALGDDKYRVGYQESTKNFEVNLADLDQLSPRMNTENQRRLQDLKSAYADWSQLPGTLFELRNDQFEREPAYRLLATDGTKFAGNVLIDVSTLIQTQGNAAPTRDSMSGLQDMANFQGNFEAMFSALRGYVTTRNRIFRTEYEVNLADNKNAWDRLMTDRSMLTANQQTLLDRIAKNREAFLAVPQQVFDILEDPKNPDHWRTDLELFSTKAEPLSKNMQQLLSDMTADQQTLLTSDLAAGRQDLANINRMILAGGLVALALGILMAYIARENIAGPISRLTLVADQIRAGHLEAQAAVESKDETGILAETFNSMTAQLRQTLTQVRKEKKRADDLLEVVIPIGADLASEKNFNRLLEKMLMEAKSFCHANAGTLYLKTQDNHLRYVIIRDDAQKITLGGTTGQEVPFAPIAMYRRNGEPNDRVIASFVALSGSSVNVDNAQTARGFDFSGPTESRVYTDSMATSLLALPLKDSQGQVLGVLQLMNPEDPETKAIIPFDSNLQRMMESFSLLAVAALEGYLREQSLQQQIQQLKIEIDEVKRQKQVSEIVETDFFQGIQARARAIRERKRPSAETPNSPQTTP